LYIEGSQKITDVVSIGELAYYGYIDGSITANHLTVEGSVGINDTNPSQKLSVNGGIMVNGSAHSGIRIPRGVFPSNSDLYGSNSNRHGLREWQITNLGELKFQYWHEYSEYSKVRFTHQGLVYSNGNNLGSDDRIKENEKLIVNATETLSKLTPQNYDKYLNMDLSGSFFVESGLIAQEVYYNAPELRHLVTLGTELDASGNKYTPTPEEMDLSGVDIGSDPDYGSHGWSKTENSSLNYQGLIAYLIKSNQELVGRIDSLKTDISAIMTHLDL
jgi:hypothetical protein